MYEKTNWVDGETPLSAQNMNKIENQLEKNTNDIAVIIESGSNDNGSWIKYSDGTMICRNTFTVQAIINKPAGGNWYYAQPNINKPFPQEFVGEYPQISIETVNYPDGSGDWGQIHMKYIDLTKISSVVFKDTVSSDNSKTFNLSYIAIGRWK